MVLIQAKDPLRKRKLYALWPGPRDKAVLCSHDSRLIVTLAIAFGCCWVPALHNNASDSEDSNVGVGVFSLHASNQKSKYM